MAGFSISAEIDGELALKISKKTAKKQGFAVTVLDDWEFQATKGNLAASIFLGAFIAYCDFRIVIREDRNDAIVIRIERNTPWWTGIIGVNRVKNHAKSLADAIEDAILDQDGEVLKRKEF